MIVIPVDYCILGSLALLLVSFLPSPLSLYRHLMEPSVQASMDNVPGDLHGSPSRVAAAAVDIATGVAGADVAGVAHGGDHGAIVHDTILPLTQTPVKERGTLSADATPPKRLKLNGKQAPPVAYSSIVPTNGGSADMPKWIEKPWPKEAHWDRMSVNVQAQQLINRVRSCWVFHLTPEKKKELKDHLNDQTGWVDAQTCGRKLWAHLDPDDQKAFAHRWIEMALPPPYVLRRIDAWLSKKGSSHYAWTKAVMLTYNGDWGRLTDGANMDLRGASVAEVVERFRSDATIQAKWDQYCKHMSQVTEKLRCCDYASAFEICTTTLKDEGVARVHAHTFIRSERKFRLPHVDDLIFQESQPHVADSMKGSAYQMGRNSFAGMFYLLPDKIGSVFAYSTKAPFSQYNVQGQWIMCLLQAGKVSVSTARPLLLKTCYNVVRYKAELDVLEEEEERGAIKDAQALALRLLGDQNRAFKRYDIVDSWLAQYTEIQHRYRFLVLDGPSRLGKSEFAKAQAPPNTTHFLVNCGAGAAPDLHGFKYNQHGLILFDEISPFQVIKEKLLFQAGTGELQLGTSSTNCHAYTVFVWKTRIVLATNTWRTELAEMPEEDQEWLVRNSFYMRVESPLFEASDDEMMEPSQGSAATPE